MKCLIVCTLVILCLAGCTTQSARQEQSKAQQFSTPGFEEEMVKAGKEDELEMAKQRERAYLASEGNRPDQQEVTASN